MSTLYIPEFNATFISSGKSQFLSRLHFFQFWEFFFSADMTTDETEPTIDVSLMKLELLKSLSEHALQTPYGY